jgi:hypothetical protein
MLYLELSPLPADRIHGTELINGVPKRLPLWSGFLHPLAARSYLDDLAQWVVVVDMFRPAEASLIAIASGTGSRPPGYSGHNYGFSIDVKLDPTLTDLRISKAAFDRWMVERGWYCARRDAVRGTDDAHYDYLRAGAELNLASTADPIKDVEQLILRVYGDALFPNDEECQVALKKMKLFGGVVDGVLGPLTQEAIRIFQRAWNLVGDDRVTPGALDARTRRTLAYVAHQRRLAPIA